jgi:CheY-like chemotaxis protein
MEDSFGGKVPANAILFVDDEQMVLNALRRSLVGFPIPCDFICSPIRALQELSQREFAVVVSDMRMPEMDGIAFLQRVKERWPHTCRVILSAYAEEQLLLHALNSGSVDRYLTKPWKVAEQLMPMLQECLALYGLRWENEQLSLDRQRHLAEIEASHQELKRVADMLRDSDESKNRIMRHLTEEIMPFLSEVIEKTHEVTLVEDRDLANAFQDLGRRGMDILALLIRVKALVRP